MSHTAAHVVLQHPQQRGIRSKHFVNTVCLFSWCLPHIQYHCEVLGVIGRTVDLTLPCRLPLFPIVITINFSHQGRKIFILLIFIITITSKYPTYLNQPSQPMADTNNIGSRAVASYSPQGGESTPRPPDTTSGRNGGRRRNGGQPQGQHRCN